MRIETTDAQGLANGWLMPIWNCREQDWRPDQVYLTVVRPGCSKGPHLHKQRCGRFVCIAGNVKIITRTHKHPETLGLYSERCSGDDYEHALIHVAPGVPAQLCNIGETDAFVLNLPSPAWSAEEPDDWPVTEWNPPCHP